MAGNKDLRQTSSDFIVARCNSYATIFGCASKSPSNSEAADLCSAWIQRSAEGKIKCPRKAWTVIVPFRFEWHSRIQPCSSAGWRPSSAFSPVSARFCLSVFFLTLHSDPEYIKKTKQKKKQTRNAVAAFITEYIRVSPTKQSFKDSRILFTAIKTLFYNYLL